MSRIGKAAIPVPQGTKVEIRDRQFLAEGPKGKVAQPLFDGIEVDVSDGTVRVSRRGNSGPERAMHGLARSLFANAVQGVSEGFSKVLEIHGVGYRADLQGKELHLALGYSHPVVYRIPEGIQVEVERQTKITVSGADKQQVGQVAAEIRGLRRPDAYKGKGVRYAGERLRLKVGKAGAGSGA